MNGDSERSEPGTPNTDVDERALLKSHGMRPEANLLSSLLEKFDAYMEKNAHSTELIISPRRKLALEKLKNNPPEKFFVVSPLPYAVLVLLGAMIVMIFVNVLPISGIVCLFAVLMIVAVALGNHLRGQQCWVPELVEGEEAFSPNSNYRHADTSAQAKTRPVEAAYTTVETGENGHERAALTLEAVPADDLGPLTREDEVDNLNRFFEALYGSIDYNLLLIFLGLFIVIDNLSFTGIPRFIWNKIVGNSPFHTFGSVLGISAFVLFTSQFLGNVPVIQLAKPNVEGLDDNTKRLAWAILSFVATVGGNLTLTGSAGTSLYVLYFSLSQYQRMSGGDVVHFDAHPPARIDVSLIDMRKYPVAVCICSEHYCDGEGDAAGRQHGHRLLPPLPRVLLDHHAQLRRGRADDHRHRRDRQRHWQQLVNTG
jgi:hypothetical protein